MKRICFLTDSIFSVGGVQRVTAVIAKELAKDYDVTILTKDKSSQEDTSLYGLNEANIHYRYFEFPKTRSWKYYFCKAYSYLYRRYLPQTPFTSAIYAHSSFPAEKRKVLLREFKKGQYDVIIGVHASLSVKLASCKKSLKGTRLIGWIHNSYEALFSEGSLYVGSDLRKHYEWQLAKLVATIVLSNDDAQRYHIATKVIYNPLTLKPDSPSTGTSNKFLAVGRFSRQHKGFDLLIEAFHLFAETNDDWTLDIVGEGPEEPLYRQLIEDYGLQKRITIHPFTNHIQRYYHEAQVYVLSSRWEGFGLVLVEAMAHGLPVVSSNLPTSYEIMGDFGLYFINGDVKGLAHQMQAATQLDWAVVSQKAIETAHRFDLKSICQQWHQLIEPSV